jgi:non-ribosomal peptide synthetase component F
VTTSSIHRCIEQQAATRAADIAIVEQSRSLSYRELNQAANVVARRLIALGFRRGSHAWVRMPHGTDLALVLFAVLKAGGSYTWLDPARANRDFPEGISIAAGHTATENRYLSLDPAHLLEHVGGATSPNLPVITRASDIACVLRDDAGRPVILVPHEALTSLRHAYVSEPAAWTGEPGALDLWLALLTGRTAVVEAKRLDAAA